MTTRKVIIVEVEVEVDNSVVEPMIRSQAVQVVEGHAQVKWVVFEDQCRP